MRLLVTGAGGQLGQMLVPLATAHGHAVAPIFHAPPPRDVPGARVVDIADLDAARAVVLEARPDAVVHAAALTDVDACERDPARAMRVNADATGALASAAQEIGARFLYVSTDYVFDGEKGGYREADAPKPINAYGVSKLEGERRATSEHARAIVARTSVVFGPHKSNFVRFVIDSVAQSRAMRIVEDQRVSPTYAGDLAAQILALLNADATGVWHTTGASPLSRLEMAREIIDAWEGDASLVTPVKSSEFQWLARRPRDTTLDVSKVTRLHAPLTFADALARLKEDLS